eukprot:CAMPEP_0113306858 /NCGR_PEP_ID=MMETSP0010_2-20120614/5945_1 /TAXON_ID=216773 ORGANISM="Corethron hystrix, Strain 308" /NCGR_SAMPLE_ID=MMETSP0010_2 /ASSEMBLY_ACC=CAM_ASM_000155 /LENGTH=276 /DNA_ID=CAMNT_0000161617 /DNA_START=68 /DNA_END=898 /DNA_ORIENTATION=+ /assembly_acc=CAM_ASM_000155
MTSSRITKFNRVLFVTMLTNVGYGGSGLATSYSLPPGALANTRCINLPGAMNENSSQKNTFFGPSFPGNTRKISLASSVFQSDSMRGGGRNLSMELTHGSLKSPAILMSSAWAVLGVISILVKAIKRVLPIAMEPFRGGVPLTNLQIFSYVGTCLFFAYAEGYKGFQKKFSPLVIRRAFTLDGTSPILHKIFAPFYSMALFHSTKRRKIISWSVSGGVAMIVMVVKRFPYPWRNILDAGVVVGLSWGALSIAVEYFHTIFSGKLPPMDPFLPIPKD